MKNFIIVTGGAGFVGSNLIELLLERTSLKIISINNPTVNLKSGGYLVINQTEALVSIDIN